MSLAAHTKKIATQRYRLSPIQESPIRNGVGALLYANRERADVLRRVHEIGDALGLRPVAQGLPTAWLFRNLRPDTRRDHRSYRRRHWRTWRSGQLRQYDVSQARRKHLSAVRQFLDVKPFDDDGKRLLRQTFGEAALTKEDVIDIINIGIEVLVRYRYELPAFDTLVREARAQRVATNQTLFSQIQNALGDTDRAFLDALFVVGDDPRRVSPWNDLKQDATLPTLHGMRELVARYNQLMVPSGFSHLLKAIPVVKVHQWALEGISLDAASMVDLEPNKRYAVALAVIRQRMARVTDDLCDIFCKQMRRVLHSAEEALKTYLTDNQEKTDEILRRFASLEGLLKSDQPPTEQLQGVRQTVMSRPDLCEFSRLHAEYGGKNEHRFMWHSFKPRRAELLRILTMLP